ncbi:hypothetical protein BUE80_DR008365 [Diplocarpon rosae]|nr:hypothetical protein BUE80_DR008365 [Diplocarpon rosae]
MGTDTIRLRAPSIYGPKAKPAAEQQPDRQRRDVAAPGPAMARAHLVRHAQHPAHVAPGQEREDHLHVAPSSTASRGLGRGGGLVRIDDEVRSEPIGQTWMPQPRSIRGVDTPAAGVEAAWNWRGRGWLRIAGSYWEVLGWGEFESHAHGGAATTEKERWVVTWFKASLFTPMGVDVYSDRKEGMSEGLYRMISAALERGEAGEEVAGMCRAEMREVEIKY